MAFGLFNHQVLHFQDENPRRARSFGIAHIVAVWVGAFVLAVYFLLL